jgi:hypothetical protein
MIDLTDDHPNLFLIFLVGLSSSIVDYCLPIDDVYVYAFCSVPWNGKVTYLKQVYFGTLIHFGKTRRKKKVPLIFFSLHYSKLKQSPSTSSPLMDAFPQDWWCSTILTSVKVTSLCSTQNLLSELSRLHIHDDIYIHNIKFLSVTLPYTWVRVAELRRPSSIRSMPYTLF